MPIAASIAAALCAGPVFAQGMPTPPVIVATPLVRDVLQWDEFTGRFQAVKRVEIRARVSGMIDSVNFADGTKVHAGDLLFTIDQRPFVLAVQSAQADISRTKALVVQTANDFARAAALVKSNETTARDYDQRRASFDSARAQELSAEAALGNAQLNLDWSQVRAPIDGRVSDRRIDAGNLVQGGENGAATLLTTIVSLDPIYLVFDGSESDYLRYQRLNATGQRPSSRNAPNPVRARLSDETAWTHYGRMDFIDNEVDAQSGTIRGRAILDNKDGFLTPGTFARLELYGGKIHAMLVPDASIVSDQAQKIVFVVGQDNKIVARPVKLGSLSLGLRVIADGLKPEDRVVIGGLANPFVRPGAAVAPQPGTITAQADD